MTVHNEVSFRFYFVFFSGLTGVNSTNFTNRENGAKMAVSKWVQGLIIFFSRSIVEIFGFCNFVLFSAFHLSMLSTSLEVIRIVFFSRPVYSSKPKNFKKLDAKCLIALETD